MRQNIQKRKDPVELIVKRISGLSGGLSNYAATNLVKDAQDVADVIKELRSAQIRKVFGAIKSLEMEFRREFNHDKIVLLKPKIAYVAVRQNSAKPLQRVLNACIDRVRTDEGNGKKDFGTLVAFFEAILAYHKGD